MYKQNQKVTIMQKRLFGFSIAIAWILTSAILYPNANAVAYPIIDQDVYYHGGALQIEILAKDAAYTSQIYLKTDWGGFFIGESTDTGLLTDLNDPAAIGLYAGDDFVITIHVMNTGYDFVMGPGTDNVDGVPHAKVTYLDPGITLIGFEDLYGGGDFDYNDVMLRVTGDIGIERVPEPSSALLILLGLTALGLLRRRLSRNQ
jgi:Domain of unknown function (DUF4114)/PEP-CTERM motif